MFFYGPGILFYSPNLIKNIYKRLFKNKILRKIEKHKYNVFISQFTFDKLTSFGYIKDFSRDLVVHNVIDFKSKFKQKILSKNEIVFSCIVRDVPHKNFSGAILFCEYLAELSGQQITIHIT